MDKAFRMPNGEIKEASDIDELLHDLRHPAKDAHIVPGIKWDSFLSIPKFADANYVAILTRTKSTSTMPTKQQLLSLGARFSEDGDANKQTYGEFPSKKTSSAPTPTQSSATDARQNFFPTDHHPTKQSTTCMS